MSASIPGPIRAPFGARNRFQNTLTLGLSLQFLLLGPGPDEDPRKLVAGALDTGMAVGFASLGEQEVGVGLGLELPEVRCCVRRRGRGGYEPWRGFSVMGEKEDVGGAHPHALVCGEGDDYGGGGGGPGKAVEKQEGAVVMEEAEVGLGLVLLGGMDRRPRVKRPMTAIQLLRGSDEGLDVAVATAAVLRDGSEVSSGYIESKDLPEFPSLPAPVFNPSTEGEGEGDPPVLTLKQLLLRARSGSNSGTPSTAATPMRYNLPEAEWQTVGPTRAQLEVSTPVMRERSWQRIVFKMLDSLTMLDQRAHGPPLKIQFNEQTGLHIHVGRRDGWSVHQLKKILKAIVIFEEVLDLYHPDSRQVPAMSEEEPQSDTDMFQSNVRFMRIHGLSRQERVKWVDLQIHSRNARTHDEGVRTVCDVANGKSKAAKYNFLTLLTNGTIEFRQAIGTLQQVAAEEFIHTVLNFVHAAINTPHTDWYGWARGEDDAVNDGDDSTLAEFLDHGWAYRVTSIVEAGVNWDLRDELGVPPFVRVERRDSDFEAGVFSSEDRQQATAA